MKLNILSFVFVLLAVCGPAPIATPAPVMTDAQFQDRTGTWIIATDTDYRVGILPMPAQVTLTNGKAVAVALAFEGPELPVKVIDFTMATMVSTIGHLYPAGLIMEMGCWPGVMTDTYNAWVHVAQQWLCGDGTENPGVTGVNGIVILFNIDDSFTQAAGINFSIGDRLYFTATP